MIVDAQIHLWEADRPDRPWPKSGASGRTAEPQRQEPMGAEEALAAMDAAGVARAVIVPPSWEGDRNDVALAAAAAHPDRFAIMGRLAGDPRRLETWRDQPGMLGLRQILANGSEWVEAGVRHWLWGAAMEADIPLMIAASANMGLLTEIVRAYPRLRIIVDHMGARVHQTGAAAFSNIDAVVALAAHPQVAVKATALPCYSDMPRPWADVSPYVHRLFDAFGAQRLFWGSDMSRLPCPYTELIEGFSHDLPWLKGRDLELVMGEAILAWLAWP